MHMTTRKNLKMNNACLGNAKVYFPLSPANSQG